GELFEAFVDALVPAGQVAGVGLVGLGGHRLLAFRLALALALVLAGHGTAARPPFVPGIGAVLGLAQLLEQVVERLVLGGDVARSPCDRSSSATCSAVSSLSRRRSSSK